MLLKSAYSSLPSCSSARAQIHTLALSFAGWKGIAGYQDTAAPDCLPAPGAGSAEGASGIPVCQKGFQSAGRDSSWTEGNSPRCTLAGHCEPPHSPRSARRQDPHVTST